MRMLVGTGEFAHLGGYVEGGDPRTFCPEVWKHLIERYKVKSVLDVGCGEGHSTTWFRDQGIWALGVDGIDQPKEYILQHDFTSGPLWLAQHFDLAWCCEFLEHVEEKFISNYMVTLSTAKVIACTAAVPGQSGHHHVNCQELQYWVNEFGSRGYHLNKDESMICRKLAGNNNFFAATGMIFEAR
jgi:hypothetical protein